MPAIVTHDLFGRETAERAPEAAGNSTDELEAFLLGNQGPDPLFFAVLDPTCTKFAKLGSAMHKEKTAELLFALKEAIDIVFDDDDQALARAYARGFLGHYSLDCAAHPLIYAQQYAICNAGIDGLTERSAHEVHATIECEFDEMMLYTRRGETILTYKPWEHLLLASDHLLRVISLMYSYMCIAVYGRTVPDDLFTRSVKAYRTFLKLTYTPGGKKRFVLSNLERLVREHSFYNAASMEVVERTESSFENRDHNTWENPFTGATTDASFADLMERAQAATIGRIAAFEQDDFDTDSAEALTQDLDFDGRPKGAVLLSVEDAE